MSTLIKGIDASPGIAIGNVFIYEEQEINISDNNISDNEISTEIEKLKSGQSKTKEQLLKIKESTLKKLGAKKAEIFDGHITLLEDEDLFDEVIEKIEENKINASNALSLGIEEYCEIIGNLDDAYLRERVADLKDICKRWIYNIEGIEPMDLSNLEKNSIIVANDLTPSDTAQIDLKNVLAFITEVGGKTAHSSIMARSLELPAIVGTKNILTKVKTGDLIIVDALKGDIILNPNENELKEFEEKQVAFLEEKEELAKLKDESAITKDGKEIKIWGNIGNPNDVEGVLKNGAQGIGLYRSEFLFMNSETFPTEEEQFIAYKTVAEKMEGKPVTIRTMDIGGDKDLPYMDLPKEMNPFLGWRAIRISLEFKDMFKTQLRAILRASAFGHIKIMYPMIISAIEVKKANEILDECKNELKSKNIEFNENIQTGIMVETPAIAIRAKQIAREVDFFSIGTNDLTQYLLAADRGNEKISHLYSSFNPAVLQAIQMIIDGAHEAGITVSMCGEFAGDDRATGILLGMGLDAYSMSGISIPKIKKNILNLSKKESALLIDGLLAQTSSEEVLEYIENNFKLI